MSDAGHGGTAVTLARNSRNLQRNSLARLDRKLALVTGAARGLGAVIGTRLHEAGAQVVFADVRDAEGQAVAASLGARAHYVHLDVASEGEWRAALSAAERFGGGPVTVLEIGRASCRERV